MDLAGVSLGDGISSWSEAVEQAEALAVKLQDRPAGPGGGVIAMPQGGNPEESNPKKKKGWNKNWKGKTKVVSPGAQSAVAPLFGSGDSGPSQSAPRPISIKVPTSKEVDTLSAKSEALSDTVSDVQEQLHTALDRIVKLEGDNAHLLKRLTHLQKEISTLSAKVSLLPTSAPQLVPSSLAPAGLGGKEDPSGRSRQVVQAPQVSVEPEVRKAGNREGGRRVKRGLE